MSRKFYPEFIKEGDGIRFHFNSENKHYTIRFAGRPLLLLEYYYYHLGGKEFQADYLLAKSGIETDGTRIIFEASQKVIELFDVISNIQSAGKNALVLYVNEIRKKGNKN